jgi:hypothetical protein
MSVFNDNVGLYFFSAILQGNMALFALVGVFVVFKYQHVASELANKDAQILTFAKNYFAMISEIRTYRRVSLTSRVGPAIKQEIKKLADQKAANIVQARARELLRHPEFADLFQERDGLIGKRNSLSDEIRRPFFWTTGVIIGSLIFLAAIYPIHVNAPGLEVALVVGTVIVNIWAVYLNTKFILGVLRG